MRGRDGTICLSLGGRGRREAVVLFGRWDGRGGWFGRATSEASSTLDCQRCRYRSKGETDVTGGSQEARKPRSTERKGEERGGHLINDPPSVVGSHKENPGELGDQRDRAAGLVLSLIDFLSRPTSIFDEIPAGNDASGVIGYPTAPPT